MCKQEYSICIIRASQVSIGDHVTLYMPADIISMYRVNTKSSAMSSTAAAATSYSSNCCNY